MSSTRSRDCATPAWPKRNLMDETLPSVTTVSGGGKMRVRHLLRQPKTIVSATPWSQADIPPRHKPINSRTQPMRGGWFWRSARARFEGVNYILVAECNPSKGNWKALLLIETTGGCSVVARFEDHASHPGVHAHAHCERSGLEIGPSGMGGLERAPKAGGRHRRTHAWTQTSFWEAAQAFFRVLEPPGTLI